MIQSHRKVYIQIPYPINYGIVTESSLFSPLFYIAVIFTTIIIASIIFFIRKLNFNFNQIVKSILISLLITLGIEILLYMVMGLSGLLLVLCKVGGNCPSHIEVFFQLYFLITLIPIFLIILLIYYIIKFIRRQPI